jgi:reactive chlorine resistance protein C
MAMETPHAASGSGPMPAQSMAQTAYRLMTSIFDVVQRIALPFTRISLGVVLFWIGVLKFPHPAPIVGLLQASFLWHFLAANPFVYLLGSLELLAAILLVANIAVRYVGLLVVLLFVGTLSIFLTAPAVTYGTAGFPNLALAGQFLLKDLVLAGAALTVVAGDVARRAPRAAPQAAMRRDT